jgi:serine protease AprX
VQVGIEDFAADEDRWVRAVEWADSMGARIINSSVGFREFVDRADYQESDLDGDGGTGVNLVISTRMADEAARRGILVVNAMGAAPALPTSML